MEGTLEFATKTGVCIYTQRLIHVAGDSLAFAEEWVQVQQLAQDQAGAKALLLATGHVETKIGSHADAGHTGAQAVRQLLNHCRVYHFHDTSATARVRQACYIRDNRALQSDAGNLAAVLLDLQNFNNSAYKRIVSTIRLLAPFFDDFQLESGTGDKEIFLDWREKGSDQVFGPHQLSDGMLRAMCLITLLMQPEDDRWPDLIIVDEPELGLHPYALNLVASLFKKVSHHTQVLVSTQSTSFVNNFDAEDVIVVNREGKGSQFTRPDPAKLEAWLDEYSLGEIWEKNVIGGGPH